MKEVRLHGRGGQGLLRAAHIMVKTAVSAGGYGSFIPYFGVERKGAPVYGFLRLDDKAILPKTQVYNPDCIIVLDDTLLDQVDVFEGLKEGSIVVINTKSSISDFEMPPEVKKVGLVDATEIALRHLGRNIPNTVTLGAFCKATDWLPIDELAKIVGDEFNEQNILGTKEGFASTTIYTEGWKIDNKVKEVSKKDEKENKMDMKWISPLGDEGISEIDTGKWRINKPIIDHDKCVMCATCARYCPVGSIRKENPTAKEIFVDLNYCKGCGICEIECPTGAIRMVREEGDE